ncbi:hypothetical protein BLNAU_1254 [Blattamonas nauphoetae]|uniref:Uncharacterized protein n=1 Tax=Blattamonas nauphoetae TaxID=2049346 RepID=A0ABQ9YIV7_9EUKA|nr:hypothetical protein BLNAU_1254 [Blattamonas nauphoetae]
MNLQALIVIHLLCVAATSTKPKIQPLSLQIAFGRDIEAANISENERTIVPEINMNHGIYHSNTYILDSISLSLRGSGTSICHTSSLTKTPTNDASQKIDPIRNENPSPFIFVFSNSTISISQISLDSGWSGTSVGKMTSSRLTIDQCPIISNPESSPFVIHNGWGDFGNTIFFIDCSHQSIDKSSLLALVSLTPSNINQPHRTDNSQEVSSTLVSCSGLSLCDTHLVFGSGPLVAFSSATEQHPEFSNKLETVLIGSRLVNMTSGEGKGALKEWRGCQKILDSCVTRSTNHLYGTTCIDMNLGGSLLCSNTSFSHCHSSLEPEYTENKTYTLQHPTGTAQQRFYYTQTDAITFRRCTFLSMTSTSSGAAIQHTTSPSSLTVSESSFSKCQASPDGGAISFDEKRDQKCPITISSSLFVDCSASAEGGVLYLCYGTTCTVTDSVISNSSVRDHGAGLYLYELDCLSLSNSVFEKCITGTTSFSSGGGLYNKNVGSTTMDSVLFRECGQRYGNDLNSKDSGTIQELAPNITNCDSTSAMPNVYAGKYDNTLIPAVPDASTASLVEIESTLSEDQTSTAIRMKVSEIVNGKMFVLMDNTDNYTPPNVGSIAPQTNSPPAIARLLIFDFSSSTESATQTVSFGDWEELQYESEYCVVGASIANTRLSILSSIVLTTPNPPRIIQITCSLGSGTNHCWLQLKGRTLPAGIYTVKLVGIQDFSFSVEFDGSTEENTLNMFSSRHSEKLFGTESKLTFSTKYEVASITFEGSSEPVLLDPPRLFFTTPRAQHRLTSFGPATFKNESTKDIILIPLDGTMKYTSVSLTLSLLSSTLESISFPVEFSSSQKNTIEVVVYSKDESEIKMKYGMTYTVEGLSSFDETCLFESALSIKVPDEPKRIEDGWVTLNGAKDEATVSLKGRLLVDGIYSLKLDYVSQELTSEAVLSENGEVVFKVPISIALSSIMRFGNTYPISSLTIGSETVVVNSDVRLAVPNAPIATKALCDLDAVSKTKFTLSLTGSNLPSSGSFIVSLDGLSQTITVTMSSNGGLSSLVEVNKSTEIQFGQIYTISSIVQRMDEGEDEHIVFSGLKMTTPDGPTLRMVEKPTLKEDDLNSVVLNFRFENMVGGTFMMKVRNANTLSEFTLSSPLLTTFGADTGTLTELVYESGKLEYGTRYEIKAVENSTFPLLIKYLPEFMVPFSPTRVKAISSDLGGDYNTSVILKVDGVWLPRGKEMTVTMTELSGEEFIGSPITVSWKWAGGGSVSSGDVTVLVYGADPVLLRYGKSYCVTSFVVADTVSILDPKVTFTVPDEPARVEMATPTLTSLRTAAIVELRGPELESGSYSITLSSHPSNPISATCKLGIIRFEISTMTTDSIHLGFGETSTVVKVMHGLDEVFLNSDVTFTVPNTAIVKSANIHPNSINTSMTLGFTGIYLELDGFYTVTLSPPFSFDMLFNSSTAASSPELLLGRTDGLQHNTTYTIESIIRVGDDPDVILPNGSISLTTPVLPDPFLLKVSKQDGFVSMGCGGNDKPCRSIDDAWKVVEGMNVKSATFAIVNHTDQIHPITISSGMSILFSNGGTLEPTLTIPLSASMGDKAGMVVVDNAGFEVDDVAIKIESANPSFVFLSASDSTIILKEGSFIGEPLPALSLNSESEDVCSWTSGIIKLANSTTKLNRMTFSSLSQGAIHITKGTLTLRESSFDGNSPNIDSFPSVHRNIRCEEEGNVTIGSLSGGDGSADKHPHLWISHESCLLSGEDARSESPHFIPTLSSESACSWNKKEKLFSLVIVGTTMIPCGLSLKVFEMKKDKSEGKSEIIELSFDTTDSFNETHINRLLI